MKKLSIVVDNYNYDQFIGEALDGALSQTWPDVEVIVVDDGSTDNSREVINAYGDRITTVFKENGGQNSAFNLAFTSVTGDVVIFLDADDRIYPDTGQRVMEAFTADPTLARVQWPLQVVDAAGVRKGTTNPNPAFMASGDLRDHIIKFRTHVWPAQSGNAYASSAVRTLIPLPTDVPLSCDLFLAETTALIGPILSFKTAGGDYRIHGQNHWSGRGFDLDNIRRRITLTERSHQEVLRVCTKLGIACPPSATTALDVAFLSQRLASVRLEPTKHPIAADRRLPLLLRAWHAAIAHPHYSWKHKVKRVVWLAGVGLGPMRLARAFVKRFYFNV